MCDLATGLTGWTDPAINVLTPDASKAVIELENAIEPALAGEGDPAPLADWGPKYPGALLRIAGLLHLAQLGHEDGVRTAIDTTDVGLGGTDRHLLQGVLGIIQRSARPPGVHPDRVQRLVAEAVADTGGAIRYVSNRGTVGLLPLRPGTTGPMGGHRPTGCRPGRTTTSM